MNESTFPLFLFSVAILILQVFCADTYKITTIQEPPFVIYDSGKSGNEAFSGFVPDILRELGKSGGFSYTLQLVADKKYGSKVNGRWNGMVGEVVNGNDIEMAAAAITISDERKDAVDFSKSFATTYITIVYVKPSPGQSSKIESVLGLSEQTEIKYGLVKDGVTMNFFKNSNNTIYKKMWTQMKIWGIDKLVTTVKEGVDKVRNGKGHYAFIMEENMAQYYINKKPCDLVKISEVASKQDYAFALKKNSALKAKVDAGLQKMKDSKLIKTLQDKWWGKTCQDVAISSSTRKHVSFFMSALTIPIMLFV